MNCDQVSRDVNAELVPRCTNGNPVYSGDLLREGTAESSRTKRFDTAACNSTNECFHRGEEAPASMTASDLKAPERSYK